MPPVMRAGTLGTLRQLHHGKSSGALSKKTTNLKLNDDERVK
jgi:hypothetical protein